MLVGDMEDISHPTLRTLSAQAVLLTALTLVGSSCSSSDDDAQVTPPSTPNEPVTVLDRAADLGFGQFVALAKASTYEPLLESDVPVTVFAPTDASFALLPDGELSGLFLPGAEAELDAFVAYHITIGSLDSTALEGLTQIPTLGAADAYVDVASSGVIINDAAIDLTDLAAENGVVHGIDRPLEVPRPILETMERRGLDTLVELIELAGLSGSVNGGQLTVISPTEAAFDALPAGELDFLRDPANQAELRARLDLHLLPGVSTASGLVAADVLENMAATFLFFDRTAAGETTVNGALFEDSNIRCSDGIIHTIGAVFDELPTVRERAAEEGLLTMGSLIFAGGLTAELDDSAPLTLFAPTDLAIEFGLEPGVIDSLVDPSNLARLQKFLRAHAVPAPLAYGSLVPGTTLTAVSGDPIDVTESMGTTTLNGAVGLTVRDVFARNGVLHVIDGVLDDGML
jgi:uncharacterized surface protein with fasciclin (FAS1) repeats